MDEKLYIHPPLVERAYDWKNGPQPKTRRELDRFFASAPVVKVKDQICEMGRRIYEKGYTDGNGGNISVRVGEDLVLCTPTLCCKGFMKREDICLVDMKGGQLCGIRPRTSEVKVHIAMMKATGMNACIHCHPPHCNAFLFAGMVPPNGVNPDSACAVRDAGHRRGGELRGGGREEVERRLHGQPRHSLRRPRRRGGGVVRRERRRILPGAPSRRRTRRQGEAA